MSTTPIYSQLEDCDKQACEDLSAGAALIIVREHCPEGEGLSFCIPCIDQLAAASFTTTTQYLDIPNQCSITPTKKHQGDTATVATTFGSGIICDPVKYAAMIGKQVSTSSDGGSQIVKFSSKSTKIRYFEVVMIPYEGEELSTKYAIILPYAIAMAENVQESFGVSDVRQIQTNFMAQPHRDIDDLAVRVYDWPNAYPDLASCDDMEPLMIAA